MTQSTARAFFQPYSVDKLVHAPLQLVASGLKQLSREAGGPDSLDVFESLYRNSDLVMAGRRYLYPIVVDCYVLSSLLVALMSSSPRNKKSDESITLAPLAHL